MRILLVGEYSRLHNSLKEGLLALGHDVLLIGTGDGFKQFPVDHNYEARFFNKAWLKPFVSAIHKLTSIHLIQLERGYRFKKLLPKLKGFDVVQLINERAIHTTASFEIKLLVALFKHNKKAFLLSCGTDYKSVNYAMEKKFRYSILTPFHEDPSVKKQYQFILRYLKPDHYKVHKFLYQNSNGVIASDIDYHLPLLQEKKYLGLIANPINTDTIKYIPLHIEDKIVIFHGINRSNYIKKGNRFFDQALDIIANKYSNKIDIIRVENIPYQKYIELYNNAHIVLDQVYAYDQGYNALEAMAKGKVVFTGAEQEWLKHYAIEEDTIAINALPNTQAIVKKLEWLILNPQNIKDISKQARLFIEKEHDYKFIAKRYIETWKKDL